MDNKNQSSLLRLRESTKIDISSELSEEHREIKGLNCYEIKCKPLIESENSLYKLVTLSDIVEDLTCPICLNFLNKPMAVKGCFHRFCYDCIVKSLRFGNKECPTCRIKCVSRRHLREDKRIDSIIDALYPKRAELQENEAEMLDEMITNNQIDLREWRQSVEAGLARQATIINNHFDDNEDDISHVSDSTTPHPELYSEQLPQRLSNNTKQIKKPPSSRRSLQHPNTEYKSPKKRKITLKKKKTVHMIEFVLERNELEQVLPELSKPVLCTPAHATVKHICQYLSKKLYKKWFEFEIIVEDPKEEIAFILDKNDSIGAIDKQFWRHTKEKILRFSLLN